jgi:hypothetical protein
MTIIDTTLYANGALRLSRHGAGRGGNVLMLDHNGTTDQCNLSDAIADLVEQTLTKWDGEHADYDADSYFAQVKGWHGWTSESAMTRQSSNA